MSNDRPRRTWRKVALFTVQLVPLFVLFGFLYGKILPAYERLVLPAANLGLRLFSVPLEIRQAPESDALTAFVLSAGVPPRSLVTHETPEAVFLSLILLPALLLATPVGVRSRLKLLLAGAGLLYVIHAGSLVMLFSQLWRHSEHNVDAISAWLYVVSLNSGQIGAVMVWAFLTGGYWLSITRPKGRIEAPAVAN